MSHLEILKGLDPVRCWQIITSLKVLEAFPLQPPSSSYASVDSLGVNPDPLEVLPNLTDKCSKKSSKTVFCHFLCMQTTGTYAKQNVNA